MNNEQRQTFEDAREQAQGMFDAPAQEEQVVLEEQTVPEADPAQRGDEPEGDPQMEEMLSKAADTAEVAAQTAAEKDGQLRQVMQELEAVKQQNAQLGELLKQQNAQQEESVVEQALAMPVLDVSGMAFDDEETVRQKQEAYAKDMADYVREQLRKEFDPFLSQAKDGMREKEKSEVVASLSQLPELADLKEMMPKIENILKNNKVLASDDVPMDEKIVMAYAVAKGVDAMNAPKEKAPTAQELMALYENNPEFQELVEKKRLADLGEGQQVPVFSASSGAVNAALNIEEKPKSFEEASERVRTMFGQQ